MVLTICQHLSGSGSGARKLVEIPCFSVAISVAISVGCVCCTSELEESEKLEVVDSVVFGGISVSFTGDEMSSFSFCDICNHFFLIVHQCFSLNHFFSGFSVTQF